MRHYKNISGSKKRFYRFDEQIHKRKVAGEWKYVIDTWRGRIGREPGIHICFDFDKLEEAIKKLEQIHQDRIKHGYLEVSLISECEMENGNQTMIPVIQMSFAF